MAAGQRPEQHEKNDHKSAKKAPPDGVIAEVQAQNSPKGNDAGVSEVASNKGIETPITPVAAEVSYAADPSKAYAAIVDMYNKIQRLPKSYQKDFLACYEGDKVADNPIIHHLKSQDAHKPFKNPTDFA
jgi:hypothetical protein